MMRTSAAVRSLRPVCRCTVYMQKGRRPEAATLDSGAFYMVNVTASNALSWVKPAVRACVRSLSFHEQPCMQGWGVSACFLLA
jgi:hypothetical protein